MRSDFRKHTQSHVIKPIARNGLLMTTAKEGEKSVKIAKPFNNETIEQNVISILRSGMLVQGKFVKQFESKLSEYIGCKHVIAVNSGTAALQVGIAAIRKFSILSKNVIPEIVTTPLSFAATANAIIGSDCLPVFADIDPKTFNIDPSLAKEKMTDETIAIEPVDVYGLPADIDSIRKIAGRRKVSVVEDAAEAIGASYNGRKIGNVSEVSCFSTYATKNLHTCEGGFITTNNEILAEEMRMIRNQGQAVRYNQVTLGFNFRMQEINAAIGLEQLLHLDNMNQKRKSNAQSIIDGLRGVDCIDFQKVDNPNDHAWYLFSLTLNESRAGMTRDVFVQKLRDQGIEADVAWPTPIHLQPYYRQRFGFKEGDYPIAEKISRTVFQLPIQPFLSNEEIQRVIRVVKSTLS